MNRILFKWKASIIWDENLTHCAMSIAFANKNKHVISTRDIRHVIRALKIKSYRDNLLIQKKQDVVSTSYLILIFINTQCRRIFEFVTHKKNAKEIKKSAKKNRKTSKQNSHDVITFCIINHRAQYAKSNESRCRRIEIDDKNHEFERFNHYNSSDSVLVDIIYSSFRRNIYIRFQLE